MGSRPRYEGAEHSYYGDWLDGIEMARDVRGREGEAGKRRRREGR